MMKDISTMACTTNWRNAARFAPGCKSASRGEMPISRYATVR
jgi:hypothetical protein